ncbi:hypothetical protein H0H92_015794 [Tricholoma furcatifolium]|nr:hypothetical protein H0H92_015794 [Tricholoma furcatifolium]
MFARVHALFLFFLFALCASAATVLPRDDNKVVPRGGSGDGSTVNCNANTGTEQCCNSVVSNSDPVVSLLEGLLGVVLDLVPGLDVGCES